MALDLRMVYDNALDQMTFYVNRVDALGAQLTDEYEGQPLNVGVNSRRRLSCKYSLTDNSPVGVVARSYREVWGDDPKYFSAVLAIFFGVPPATILDLLPKF